MKSRLSFLSVCAMLLVAGSLFSGCSSSTAPPNTITASTDVARDVPSLSVNQLYKFSVTSGSGASGTYITGVSSYDNGVVRVFWKRAAGDTSAVTVNAVQTSSTTAGANEIVWAPALRSGTIRLYETADATSGHWSGLILGTAGSTSSTAAAASTVGADKSKIDLVLATDNTISFPYLTILSADAIGSTVSGGKMTAQGASPSTVKGGLMNDWQSSSLAAGIPSGSSRITATDIPANTASDTLSLVIYIRTADGNYARVAVMPQSSNANNLWGDTGGTNSKRYIDVTVTYQPTMGWAYAGRPVSAERATNTAIRRAGSPVRE